MTLGVAVALATVVLMVVLIYIGMHIGVVLAVLSFVGVWVMRGSFDLASNLLALSVADSIAEYNFGVIPLFVFMGFVVSAANYGRDLFDVTNWMFRGIKGGLGVSTVAANAGFAAITGVSIASASVFTRIAVPEMLRFGYNRRLAVGIVAGSSVLGMLIPPSVLMILYGILTDVSIGKMFIAGIVPGIVLAIMFAIGIMMAVWIWPGLISSTASEGNESLTIGEALIKIAPIVLLIGLVMGGIYGGYFTATEAAGIGAGLSLVLAVAMRRLTWPSFWKLLVDSATVTSTICFLLIAASLYSRMLAFSGVPNFFANWIAHADFGFYTVLTIFIIVILALGAILDSTSTMLITIPIMFPILMSFNVDPIWIGIIIIVAVEIGIIIPPVGLAAFVVHDTLGRKDVTLADVFIGVFPFVIVMCLLMVLLVIFPQLTLMLL